MPQSLTQTKMMVSPQTDSTVMTTSSAVQDNHHGLSLGLGQTTAASARQSNDLKLPLLLRFEEGEGKDGQERA